MAKDKLLDQRIINEDLIEQSIDLSEILGRRPTIEEKVEFADALRNEVIDRTQQGKDVSERNFKSYTPDYAEFKGVSRSDVDLTLFGLMLNSLETEIRGDSVVLRVDSNQTGKAHGNITGSYGKPDPNPDKARDFFGVRLKDAERLAKQIERVTQDETLISILGTAPLPTVTDEPLDIASILSTIGLFGD